MHAITNGATIFRPAFHGQPVTTWLLIENTQSMFSCWADLRNRYLPNIVGSIRAANPGVPVQIRVILSSQLLREETHSSLFYGSDDPLDPQFDTRNDCRISPRHIQNVIESLASVHEGHSTSRHLIIVAVSSPSESDEANGGNPFVVSDSVTSLWRTLGYQMGQNNIRLHLMVNPTQNIQGFNDAFYEQLRIQNLEEVTPWFEPALEGFLLRFSAKCTDFRSHPTSLDPLPQVNLSPLPRSVSYPSNLNSLAVRSDSALNTETIPTPSLVNSIQQSWGLTKKRVYAAQQIREPFVSDERVNEQQNSAALSLVPTSPSTSPTRDPRQAKGKGRRGDKPAPIDLPSRRPVPYPRRSSLATPLSSPSDVAGMPFSSPTSKLNSPTASKRHDSDALSVYLPSPTSPHADPLHTSQLGKLAAATSVTSPVQMPGTRNGLGERAAWQPAYDQSNAPSLDAGLLVSHSTFSAFPPADSNSYFSNMGVAYPYPPPQVSPIGSAPPPLHVTTGTSCPPPDGTPAFSSPLLLPKMPQLSSRLLAAAQMDGSEPFIFSEEKAQESKAMLHAVGLQDVPLPEVVAAAAAAREGQQRYFPHSLGFTSSPFSAGSVPLLSPSSSATATPGAWSSPCSSSSTSPPWPNSPLGALPFAQQHKLMLQHDCVQCSCETACTQQRSSSLMGWNGYT